jgi:hypothetical protein
LLESIWSPNGVHGSRYPSLFRRLPRPALSFQRLGIHGALGCHQRGLVRWWRKHCTAYKGTATRASAVGFLGVLHPRGAHQVFAGYPPLDGRSGGPPDLGWLPVYPSPPW